VTTKPISKSRLFLHSHKRHGREP